jgi:hypothetical protein
VKKTYSEHQFVVMWDCYGLEYIGDITASEQAKTWAALQGKPFEVTIPNLMHMKLRAQANSQRHYEIYTVDVDPSITAKDMIKMFKSTPQEMADLIRSRGYQLYSDRADQRQVVIQ